MGKNIITQKRGKGSTSYRSPSFRFKGAIKIPNIESEGIVVDFVHCAAHSAPLARILYETGEYGLSVAGEGTYVGQKVVVAPSGDTAKGNTLELKHIPEGTLVYNIELTPGDGGKLVRASGTYARVSVRAPKGITIELPSKKLKVIHESCRATIGVVAGGGRLEKPLLKAGTMFYKKKARNHLYPVVSGSKMNAVSHPFGNKRSSRKSNNKPISRHAPPGRKVGSVAARRTGRKK